MKISRVITGPLAENCYVVCDEQTGEGIIIDPGSSHTSILKAAEGINIKYIVFTHGHFDHVGAYFKIKSVLKNCPLIAGAKEKELLLDSEKSMLRLSGVKEDGITADIYINDGDEITFGKTSLKVLETPGHTAGSICLYAPGILFSGDTLFCGGIGRTDFPTGCYEDEITSIKEKIFTLPDETIVYPGHGDLTEVIKERNGGIV